MLLESDITLLHWTLSCLLASLFRCLVLTAPPWVQANLSVRLSLVQSQLPSAACLSALQPPTLLSPVQLPTPSPGSRRQLSFASPYHFRVRRDFMSKNPLSGFAPKQTIESSALAAYPHSATPSHFNIYIYNSHTH